MDAKETSVVIAYVTFSALFFVSLLTACRKPHIPRRAGNSIAFSSDCVNGRRWRGLYPGAATAMEQRIYVTRSSKALSASSHRAEVPSRSHSRAILSAIDLALSPRATLAW
jgi:hypothetical protein